MKQNTREKLNVYQSLVIEYKKLIELGAIHCGEKLPSCRALAYERGINPNTVEKAYAELEAQGYIKIFPKKGAYADFIDKNDTKKRMEIKKQLNQLKDAGVTRSELDMIADEVYGGFKQEDEK